MSHEIEHLIQILDRSKDGLAYARPGELVHLAIIMRTRSVVAIRSRLHHLRQARKAAQNRGDPRGGLTNSKSFGYTQI